MNILKRFQNKDAKPDAEAETLPSFIVKLTSRAKVPVTVQFEIAAPNSKAALNMARALVANCKVAIEPA